MFDDEPKPKPKAHDIGQDLSSLSVTELEERIGLLKSEIARLEAAKAGRTGVKKAAEAIFRS